MTPTTQVRIRQAGRDQFAFALLEMVLRVGQTRPALVCPSHRTRRGRSFVRRRLDRYVWGSAEASGRWRIEANNLVSLVSADEVESLTAARAGAMSGKEPSDALRVSSPSFARAVLWLSLTPNVCRAPIAGGQRALDPTRQAQTPQELPHHDDQQPFRSDRSVPGTTAWQAAATKC